MNVWVDTAREIAAVAHGNQKDKSGDPYLWHPFAVANMVKDLGELYEIVALLHDVVEDTPFTLQQIGARMGGYSGLDKVLAAVEAITRRGDETYSDFIERVKTNRIATEVKKADIAHNLDESRGYRLPDSMKKRYRNALKALEE